MQPIDPTDLVAKWGIGLEAARRTLECTTQRRLCTVLRPSLSLRFRKNYRQLLYRQIRHDLFGDTFLARTKSKRGSKYSEVFKTNFGWPHVFPMAKKGDAHEALSLLFQRDVVTPKMIVDGSKE